MLTGLLSLRALDEARRGSTADVLLKGSAILYSRVACWANAETVGHIVDRLGAGLSSHQCGALRQCFVTTRDLDPTLTTFYASDVVKGLDDWLASTDVVDPAQLGDMLEDFIRNDERRPSHEVVSLYLSLHFACPFHAHPAEVARLQRIFASEAADKRPSEQTPLRVSLPDLDHLSWSDVLELRRSRYLDKFRVFVASFHLKSDADVRIASEINEALWEAVGSLKPAKSGSAVTRLVGQIPLPFSIPNPYSVYRDVKDGLAEAKLYREYGWLWFVQEARSLVKPGPPAV